MISCPVCGKNFNISGEGIFECPACLSGFSVRPLSGFNVWDRRRETGFLRAFTISVCRITAEPFIFFNAVKAESSVWPAFLFCFMVFFSAALIKFAAYEAPVFIGLSFFSGPAEHLPEFLFRISSALMQPLKMLLITVFKASALHLCVILFGGKGSVGSTFRIVLYSSVAYFALLIPVAGVLLSLCWEIWLYMEGFHVAHDIPRSRSAWAVMFPILMFMLFVILGLMVFFSLTI
ncbi:YIP1 family protein [bacterium]|jgi:hypothetical protein|nr:YIP1 family protein [bacterium]